MALGACVGCMTLPAKACAQNAKASISGRSLRGNFIGLVGGRARISVRSSRTGRSSRRPELQGLRLADLVMRVKSARIVSTRWKAGVREWLQQAGPLLCPTGQTLYI